MYLPAWLMYFLIRPSALGRFSVRQRLSQVSGEYPLRFQGWTLIRRH